MEDLEVDLGTEEKETSSSKEGENVPQDEKDKYLKDGASQAFVDSKRFKEIYWKAKESERKADSKDVELKKTQEMMVEFKRHNESLVKVIKNSMEKVASDKNVDSEKNKIEEAITKLDSNITQMMKDKAQAMKDQNWEQVVLIDDQLADAKDKKKELKNYKPEEPSKEDEDKTPVEFKRFLKSAPWYNTNATMRGAAKELDLELLEDPDWQDASTKDRLEEVRVRIEKLFNFNKEKDEEPSPKKKSTPEGLDSGGGERGTKKGTIKLTAQQVEYARNFGFTPEQYAEQLSLINGGD